MNSKYTHWQRLFWLVVVLMLSSCISPTVSGLRPEYPEVRLSFSDYSVVFVNVDSLQPTLRWESFPRPQDHKTDTKGLLSRIRDVTYDLKIWRAENDYPVEVIYTRQGLSKSLHKIEDLLEPCTKYIWTIRARFVLDDHTRVTEWGIIIPTPKEVEKQTGIRMQGPLTDFVRKLPRVPNPFFYRFMTPCASVDSFKEFNVK